MDHITAGNRLTERHVRHINRTACTPADLLQVQWPATPVRVCATLVKMALVADILLDVLLRSCYQRRSPAKRRTSEKDDDDLAASSSAGDVRSNAEQIEVARAWVSDADKVDLLAHYHTP